MLAPRISTSAAPPPVTLPVSREASGQLPGPYAAAPPVTVAVSREASGKLAVSREASGKLPASFATPPAVTVAVTHEAAGSPYRTPSVSPRPAQRFQAAPWAPSAAVSASVGATVGTSAPSSVRPWPATPATAPPVVVAVPSPPADVGAGTGVLGISQSGSAVRELTPIRVATQRADGRSVARGQPPPSAWTGAVSTQSSPLWRKDWPDKRENHSYSGVLPLGHVEKRATALTGSSSTTGLATSGSQTVQRSSSAGSLSLAGTTAGTPTLTAVPSVMRLYSAASNRESVASSAEHFLPRTISQVTSQGPSQVSSPRVSSISPRVEVLSVRRSRPTSADHSPREVSPTGASENFYNRSNVGAPPPRAAIGSSIQRSESAGSIGRLFVEASSKDSRFQDRDHSSDRAHSLEEGRARTPKRFSDIEPNGVLSLSQTIGKPDSATRSSSAAASPRSSDAALHAAADPRWAPHVSRGRSGLFSGVPPAEPDWHANGFESHRGICSISESVPSTGASSARQDPNVPYSQRGTARSLSGTNDGAYHASSSTSSKRRTRSFSLDEREVLTRERERNFRLQARERARNVNGNRFDFLYKDKEMRQRRWLARYEEKCRQEEDEFKQMQNHHSRRRAFDAGLFNDWYSSRVGSYFEAQKQMRELQQCEERQRINEELKECHFEPQASTSRSDAMSHSPRQSPSPGAITPPERRTVVPEPQPRDQIMADELVATQVEAIEALRKLDVQEREYRLAMQSDAVIELSRALEENARRVGQVMGTDEGREMLAERARDYVDMNQGLEESSAMKEAEEDFKLASEEKLRASAASALRRKARREGQRIQLARLQVVRDLIQLQRRYTDMIDSNSNAQSLIQGFDVDLVDRIKRQAWYFQARSAAERILRAEAEAAAETAAAENVRMKKALVTSNTFRV